MLTMNGYDVSGAIRVLEQFLGSINKKGENE